MRIERFLLISIFVFSLLVLGIHSCSAFGHISFTIYVNPEHSSARVNSIFSINISVADVPEPGVWAYEFKVRYNKSLLDPVSAEIPVDHFLEPELSPDNLFILDPGTINRTEGSVSFAATLLNPESGKMGSGTLANITFVVVAPGSCNLTIGGYLTDEPKFIDGNGNPIPCGQISIVEGYFQGLPPPPPPIPLPTPEAGREVVAFDFMGIYGYLTYPQECHVNDTLTYELILAAEPHGIHVNHLSINISCPTSSGEKILFTEKVVQNEDLAEDWILNKSIILIVPSEAYGKLYCSVEAETYKRFASCDSESRFCITEIRTLTYEELLAEYELVLSQYNTTVEQLDYWLGEYAVLNSTYHQLWTDYQQLLDEYNSTVERLNSWIAEYKELNDTYHTLLTDYNSLKSAYQSLQESYRSLNSTYSSLENQYDSLETDYNNLLNAFNTLNSTYMELLSNHTSLTSDYNSLQDNLNSLQTRFDHLSNSYNSLNSTYHNLLEEYERLKTENEAIQNGFRRANALWIVILTTTLTAVAVSTYLLSTRLGKRRSKSENSAIEG